MLEVLGRMRGLRGMDKVGALLLDSTTDSQPPTGNRSIRPGNRLVGRRMLSATVPAGSVRECGVGGENYFGAR